MWLTTTRGFYSAVQHRTQPDQILVRARARDDLERLLDLLPDPVEPEIVEIPPPEADYRYRVTIHREVWAGLVQELLAEVTYDNFKNAVKDRMPQGGRRASIYLRVWHALRGIRDSGEDEYAEHGLFPEPLFPDDDLLPPEEWFALDEDTR